MQHVSLLPDPYHDRPISAVPPPPNQPLSRVLLFPQQALSSVDVDLLRDFLLAEGRLAKEDLMSILNEAGVVMRQESTLVQISDPVSIVGDLHGQYYDLCNLLHNLAPLADNHKYVFMGDYVDRGVFGVEVLALLLAMKVRHQDTIVLLRGNHESRTMTSHFNFREEVLHKYDQEVYDLMMFTFDCMPLACVINKQFICMHGGINAELTLGLGRGMQMINRFQEIPDLGSMCDITWSDPMTEKEGQLNRNALFLQNNVRGCSSRYSAKAVK